MSLRQEVEVSMVPTPVPPPLGDDENDPPPEEPPALRADRSASAYHSEVVGPTIDFVRTRISAYQETRAKSESEFYGRVITLGNRALSGGLFVAFLFTLIYTAGFKTAGLVGQWFGGVVRVLCSGRDCA